MDGGTGDLPSLDEVLAITWARLEPDGQIRWARLSPGMNGRLLQFLSELRPCDLVLPKQGTVSLPDVFYSIHIGKRSGETIQVDVLGDSGLAEIEGDYFKCSRANMDAIVRILESGEEEAIGR